ncbi:MAG: PAS domain S-box protein [Deltaproteobacteria bacterium]|nr:PAS domain S-box protein [Deltaproteobacteria bacterium]
MKTSIVQERKKRKREKYIILGIGIIIIVLSYLAFHLTNLSSDLPYANSIFFFGLINFNLILVMLLLYFVIRNIVKLALERKSKVLGAKLKTKLAVAFVAFSIIPTVLMFAIAVFYINNSFNKWFDERIDQALQSAVKVANTYYDRTRNTGFSFAEQIRDVIAHEKLLATNKSVFLQKILSNSVRQYDVDSLGIYLAPSGRLYSQALKPGLVDFELPPPLQFSLEQAFQGSRTSEIHSVGEGDLIRCIVPLFVTSKMDTIQAALVLDYYVPERVVAKISNIVTTYQDYKNIHSLKFPLESVYLFILIMITLLIVFSATWIGFYIAKQLTIPIELLARGTQEVASGNLQFRIKPVGSDELGTLVASFNKMTRDLQDGSSRLEQVNRDLQQSNTEIEERRRYMEAILQNVTVGVISADAEGRITTMNVPAQELFEVKLSEILGRNYRELIPSHYAEEVDQIVKELLSSQEIVVERHIQVSRGEKSLALLVGATTIRDNEGKLLGIVAILDDLTELLRAQRMAAWREVARRIAHEIKNPLTPIKLSAQRLRKNFSHRGDDPEQNKIFDECTQTIIRQVDELKELVNEFSSFARMPEAVLSKNRLENIIYESLVLYKEAHKHIVFRHVQRNELPEMDLDRDQMKRVFINLLDNAVDAIEERGEIEIVSCHNKNLQIVTVEICDTGIGMSSEVRSHLFEPYFSTKKSGTGLGLAIVQRIISDHDGFVRVANNYPRGTRVLIELPVKKRFQAQSIPLIVKKEKEGEDRV